MHIETWPTRGGFDEQVGMIREHLVLQRLGKLRQPGKVVVSVALHAGDTQARLGREILQHRHRRDIGQILAAHHGG